MTDTADDAAVERVAAAINDCIKHSGSLDTKALARAAIAAYRAGLVTDEKLWAEYKAKRAEEVPAYAGILRGPSNTDMGAA